MLAIALDTTGSTVVPVGEGLVPLDDYYLWCDHRAKDEAALITRVAHERKLPAIEWCGGVYSSEWGFAKLLHWLRHNPGKRDKLVTAARALRHGGGGALRHHGPARGAAQRLRHGAQVAVERRRSADFHPRTSSSRSIRCSRACAQSSTAHTSRRSTSQASSAPAWAEKLGLEAGIPIPVGAFDAHWDAMGAGITEGDVVNVIGTATCMMAIAKTAECVPGVCGVVNGSIHPDYVGVEAGLSACGYLFEALASRTGRSVKELAAKLGEHRAGQTGLLRLTWDNGDRTVLVNPFLGGVTLGWNLNHTAEDDLFSAIEGTAFHTRIILERMREHGVPVRRMIHGGGIPQKNEVLNQVYANVLNLPVLVPERPITSLGSALFAFLAAGTFKSLEDAQKALCPPYRTIEPQPAATATYERLFPLYRDLYFSMGVPGSPPLAIGHVLPELRRIAADVRAGTAGR